jgi:hypothetical protein
MVYVVVNVQEIAMSKVLCYFPNGYRHVTHAMPENQANTFAARMKMIYPMARIIPKRSIVSAGAFVQW